MIKHDELSTQFEWSRPNLVHEFFVDFLGGLVPGILFVVATTVALVPVLWALTVSLSSSQPAVGFGENLTRILESTQGTPNMIWITAFVFILILSYILGHLFYRRDPKHPDFRSFRAISQLSPDPEDIRANYSGDKNTWLRRSFGCITEDDCQFPYRYLYDYLEARGHNHLLNLVTWRDAPDQRSKTYINLLKVRLQFYYPDKFRRVIRNEAHVRLATSTWYAAASLYWVCFLAVILFAATILLSSIRLQFDSLLDRFLWYAPVVITPSLVWALSWYCRRATEHFIHYQRLREAFYVLEIAYTAFRDQPELLESPTLLINHDHLDPQASTKT